MASARPAEAQLSFLQEAAHLLALSAPTTSAALGAARDALLDTQEGELKASRSQLEAMRREFCGACGHLLVPGWSCRVSYETSKSLPSKKDVASTPSRPEKNAVHTCLRCDRRNVFPLASRSAKHIKGRKVKVEPPPQMEDNASKVVKSVNASSKQRKKARKGGLQAMLDKNKMQTSAQGGLGLDLMDFMQ
ncbi:hypothetical protein BS50DRAFT_568829 [Corynespora cassiicola Philippines]|uniref:Rpr2-domain-containing protein n=1 Tax=Corynespora cassiicola Philippines TaxID=1448308 RepID=A0A2T2P7C2_CORCC|nr:hypothetical protein BS50DRAFT_568829 [Corynespora cassiicola Philippines]